MSSTRPTKILHIHIPKTSGTALSAFIAAHFAPDEIIEHCENSIEWRRQKNLPALLQKPYVSGHIEFPILMRSCPQSDHFKLAVLRQPIDQIMSHLAWTRNLGEPGHEERLELHGPAIQEVVRRLQTLDFTNAQVVSDYVATLTPFEIELFDNPQTRYMVDRLKTPPLNKRLHHAHLDEALSNLYKLDLVGISERYADMLAVLCYRLSWPMPETVTRLNVSQTKFGLDRRDEALCHALQPLIYMDNVLYFKACELFINAFYDMLKQVEQETLCADDLIDRPRLVAHLNDLLAARGFGHS